LWCAFLDFEKAFDTVIHQALWIKLIESGIRCKMLKMIQSIDANVKSCIKMQKTYHIRTTLMLHLVLNKGNHYSHCCLYYLSMILKIVLILTTLQRVTYNCYMYLCCFLLMTLLSLQQILKHYKINLQVIMSTNTLANGDWKSMSIKLKFAFWTETNKM